MTHISEKLLEHGIRLASHEPGDYRIPCPECSPTRKKKADPCLSVTIDQDGGAVWNCWHCEMTGGTHERDERRYEPRRRTAAAQRQAVKLDWKPSAGLPPEVVKWFAARNIPEDVLIRNGIAAEKGWIGFPYYRNGEVVNVKYRQIAEKRFRQTKGGERLLYGLDDIADATEAVIVEGELDKLACEAVGLLNVVSVPDGAVGRVGDDPDRDSAKFAFLRNSADAIEHIEKWIIATDADGPGDAMAEELARRFGKERCARVRWPCINDAPHKDANEVLIEDGPDVLRECIAQAEPWPIEGLHSADDYHGDVLRLYHDGHEQTFSLGWASLDPIAKARPGDLVVLTGIPNHGKSEWLDAAMVNLAESFGWRFAICSFENEPPEHYAKLAEKRARMRFFEGPSARMGEGDLAASMSWLGEHFFMIRDEAESQTLDWIIANAKSAILRHGVRGIVLDPWNECEHHRPDNMTETEYIGESLGKIRRFAQRHGVWAVVVAHPTKLHRDGGKIPAPSLYDISGSANWHNKADLGIVVYRLFDTSPPQTEILIRKARRKWVGRIGKATLDYDVATGRYTDSEERKSREAYAATERQGHA